jgi:hypothetical protein
MICEEIKWVKKHRLVYNADTGKVESMFFLQSDTNDAYKIDMGHTDVSDQYRGVYRFDAGWLWNTKWWMACFEHAFGVLLVNLYVTYCHVWKTAGKTRLSHYDYRQARALAWINKDEMKMHKRKKQQRANQKARVAMRAEVDDASTETALSGPVATPVSTGWQRGRRSSATSNKSPSSSARKKKMMQTNSNKSHEVAKKALTITDKTLYPILGSICK